MRGRRFQCFSAGSVCPIHYDAESVPPYQAGLKKEKVVEDEEAGD